MFGLVFKRKGKVCGKKNKVGEGKDRREELGRQTLLRSATRFDSGLCCCCCCSSARREISVKIDWRGAGTIQLVCCSFLWARKKKDNHVCQISPQGHGPPTCWHVCNRISHDSHACASDGGTWMKNCVEKEKVSSGGGSLSTKMNAQEGLR